MRRKLLATLALSLLSSSAFAADTPTWTGFYLGANIGRASINSSSNVTLGGDWLTPSFTPAQRAEVTSIWSANHLDGDGFAGGFQGGYNHQFNRLVFGVELDYNSSNVNALRQVGPVQMTTAPAQLQAGNSVDLGKTYGIRPRFGFTCKDTLFYITAGVTYVHARGQADYYIPLSNYSKYGVADKTLHGTTWGGGVEYRFSPHLSGKVEYLRANLNDMTYPTVNRTNLFVGNTESVTQKMDYNTLRVGLNYQF
ncbi:MAG TPA: outer membrane beta-barrel protein [Arenimonas sp.]|uniref:outer membrane protein n=1 Tax=Arenimonas sp. TaxID=1872635 RepID=UPI002B8231D9|nr:outer membrane beta-barrel protein [Arenimonas sp.]HMB56998.1 outer membrane beta-barrel protein [Arenimonas sp.]